MSGWPGLASGVAVWGVVGTVTVRLDPGVTLAGRPVGCIGVDNRIGWPRLVWHLSSDIIPKSHNTSWRSWRRRG